MRIATCCAALLLGACSSQQSEESAPEPVALVKLAPATVGGVAETVTLYGGAENSSSAKQVLAAPIEAILVSIDAPVGSAVGQGQPVAHLAPSPNSRLDLAKAGADTRAANEAFARARRLRADGLVSDAEVETARAAAQTANATRTSLAGRTDALVLRARAPGYVESIAPTPGDVLAAGTAVATISNPGQLRARFGVDPAAARRIGSGRGIRITPSGGGAGFTVPILSISPVVDPQTRLASVFARIPPATGIGTGETLTGEVELGAPGRGVTIPYAALLDEGGQPYVFVVAGETAHRRPVKIGPSAGQHVAILDGLKPGETVVVAGGTALEDGMKVRTR
jgi:RND family efflux transporter MFP subunit